MALLALNQFSVLLWKNFTLKRRQFVNLTLDICLALVFPVLLWLCRALFSTNIVGPLSFDPQPIGTLPFFITNPPEWELIYTPSNINVLKEIMENVKRNLNISIKVQGFSSETDLEKYLKYDYRSERVLAAVVFHNDFKDNSDPLPLQVKYHLRFVTIQRTLRRPDMLGWKTTKLFPTYPLSVPRNPYEDDGGSPGYIREGFVAVQHAVDKAIMLYHGNSAAQKLLDDITIFIQRFPCPAFSRDGLVQISTVFLPLAFILMFSPTVLSIIQSVVWEKERRLKEYQLIIGLRNWMIWTSYFFTVFFFYIIIITLICGIFLVKEPLLRFSDFSLIFAFLICYAIASILYGFMISTFFSKVHLAASVGSFLFFASFFPFNSISQNYGCITLTTKVAACLSSNVALALGVNLLMKLEIKEIGAKWDNLWTPATIEDNLTFGYIIGMLLLDALLYGLVAWYIETVFPGVYGMSQPWYFFLMRSYWYGHPRIRRGNEEIEDCEETQYFEAASPSWVAGIQIKGLHKTFGDKVAVNNISLNLYKGQITILLGENGSGKTTVLSILTGMYAKINRVKAYINGYDISKNMTDIQKNLDFCPQQDLLFNNLTLSEHLYFYFKVKRKCPKMLPVEIDHMLSTFNLQEDRDTLSKLLSEGTKRKLSLLIALIGDSEVVILEEPSAGMDPLSKRIAWDLLQQYKHNRTILVTTHHMDEADILGDRIAIMVNGTLKCCGSSVFLKEIYGAAYHIVMETEPQCDVGKISAVIQCHIPDATLGKYTGAKLSFTLPKKHVHRFEALFDDMKERKRELGIARFDVSITTMEEVFLKVNKPDRSQTDQQTTQTPLVKDQEIRQDMKKNMTMERNNDTPVFSRLNEIATMEFNTGFPLYCQQFRSMFIKKALFSWRNWKLILLQTSIILVVTTYLLTTNSLYSSEPIRTMDLGQYGRTIVPYSVSGKSDLATNLIRSLKVFLEPKNQELRQVPGNVTRSILESKEYSYFAIVALAIEVEKNRTVITILFNNEAYHAAAMSVSMLDNILFTSLSGPRASIQVANAPQPLPLYSTHTVPAAGLQIVLNLAFALAVMASSFGFQTVTERTTKAKHVQFVSGVSALTYWLSALLWDLICFSVTCCLLLGVFKCRKLEALVEDFHSLDTLLILVLYGWAAVPLTYLGTFLFASSAAAFIKLTLFHYFSTVFSIILFSVLQYYGGGHATRARTLLHHLLMSLPSYNFAMSLMKFFDYYEVRKLCLEGFQNISEDCSENLMEDTVYSFGEDGIAKFLIALSVQGSLYLLLLFCLETTSWRLRNCVLHKVVSKVYNLFVKCKKGKVSVQVKKNYTDENVESERKRILAQTPRLKNNPLLLKQLTKIYYKCPVVKAVRNISLVVQKSECFGLLGLNGAGKTTMFKMLTGEETSTSGVVFIDGISIAENIRKVRSRIGYCPQVNPLLNHMTGRELLVMYARLQGVPEPNICNYVDTFLCSMHLESQADKVVHTYRKEDKRKLNTVIALMGKPSVVLLDEPTTGMDAGDRHRLWDIVRWMSQTGKAIIISSHRMEDCEATCTRLAIMVKGRFKCLGSPQQLKSKFGDMYTLTVKINIDEDKSKLKEFKEFIATTFPGHIINQEYRGIIYYHIPREEICWGKMFSILEEAKALFNLEDYFISPITLEQVFLAIANIDKMEHDQVIKLL
ncbi:phospholipid-transporting ATPase ABCA3-like [Saccopteryx bilineata]|uniref:phospholipid-transporting ATPase ABCA3-like n=1 Tax=Saccopteryx bilineata TaxID=59482 RepID=UPI00339041B2